MPTRSRECAEIWHRRLAHRSLSGIQDREALGIQISSGKDESSEGKAKCPVREVLKHTQILFPKETYRSAEVPFEVVHVDFTEPKSLEKKSSYHGAMLGLNQSPPSVSSCGWCTRRCKSRS